MSVETSDNPGENTAAVTCRKGRLLIFIVAYNAEKTIESVLQRIPGSLQGDYDIEILIIDDSSQDDTFKRGQLAKRAGLTPFPLTVLYNPVNQGYGGNQKIGFHYAVEHGFDWVALVHGDGQYAPECLPDLVAVLASGQAEAVFGSRMLEKRAALKGGMPKYKYVGNKILTTFQNKLLGSHLSEFHSGYRLYAIEALKKIPFALNSNDFHFDTEIIIQLLFARQRIKELPIPTFYGDEICHVNGLKYAWDVVKATALAQVQRFQVLYDPKYDCRPEDPDSGGQCEEYLIDALLGQDIAPRSHVLLVGAVSGRLKERFRAQGHAVSVKSAAFFRKYVTETHNYDYIFLLDDTLAQNPEELIGRLIRINRFSPNVKICVTVANIGFILTRVLLLFGRFSYTRRGIINLNSSRFFTLRSARKMFVQNGFKVLKVQGMPVPYSSLLRSTSLISCCSALHRFLIRLRKSLFGFQFIFLVAPPVSLSFLLDSAVEVSGKKAADIEDPGEKLPGDGAT